MTRDAAGRVPRSTETTAQLILDASANVFAEKGYTATTIADLAAAANLSRPTIYAHFGAKADVFRALAHQIRDEFRTIQTGSGEPRPGKFVGDALASHLDIYVRYFGALTVLKHQALSDPAMADIWDEIHREARRRHTRFIRQLGSAGLADPRVPAPVISDVLVAVVARFAEIVTTAPRRRREMLRHLNSVYEQLTGISANGTAARADE